MKRVLTILAILLLPMSVWAMTPVSDSYLSNVTGQAGVSINADLTMSISIGTMAWGDSDGVDYTQTIAGINWATTDGGYIGIRDFNIASLKIRARTETTDTYNGYYSSGGMLKPITIDVGQSASQYSGRTFVRIGLGSIQISVSELNFTVALEDATTFNAGHVLGEELGKVHMANIEMYLSPKSYVDIASHATSGVTMGINVIVDRFMMDQVSWGDSDGMYTATDAWTGATTSGYIGVDDLLIDGPIYILGNVTVDVYTTLGTGGGGRYYRGHGNVNETFVRIGIADGFQFLVDGAITGNVCLSSTNNFSGTGYVGTLGNFYISQFKVRFIEDSWIDIWAH